MTRILGSVVNVDGPQYKYLELPLANYGQSQYDTVLDSAGTLVGVSLTNVALSYKKRRVISLGVVDRDVPEGAELELVWGEPDGGSSKLDVERHEQTKVRVVVSPSPYSAVVRDDYSGGWRSSSALL